MKRTFFSVLVALAITGAASAQILTSNTTVGQSALTSAPSTALFDVSGSDLFEAQNQTTTTVKSNTNMATVGLFKNDIDYVVNPADYAKLQKSFVGILFGSGSQGGVGNEQDLVAVWGNKAGDLYTGVYFDGDRLANQTSGTGTTQNSVSTNNFDTTGTYTGQSVAVTTKKNVTDSSSDLVVATVGFGGFGALTLGGGMNHNVVTGDLDPTSNFGANVNGSGSVVTTTYDASGNALQSMGSTYAQNTYDTSKYGGGLFYGNNFDLGGGVKLKAYLGANANAVNNVGQGANTVYTQNFNAAALPTLGGYANASYYSVTTGNLAQNYIQIAPIGSVALALPLDKNTTFTTQVWYEFDDYLYNNNYVDQNGATQSGGAAQYSSVTTVNLSSNGDGTYKQTTAVTNGYNNNSITDTVQYAKLNLQFVTNVTDTLSFGFNYKPSFFYNSVSNTLNGGAKATSSVVANNLQATPGSDYTQVTTTVDPTVQSSSWEAKLTNKINLAAQFKAIPNVFILNSGVTFVVPGFDLTGSTTSVQSQGYTTVVKTYGNGSSTKTETTNTQTSTSSTLTDQSLNNNNVNSTNPVAFNFGGTYFFTPDVFTDFDFLTNTSSNGGAYTLNLANVNLDLIVRY